MCNAQRSCGLLNPCSAGVRNGATGDELEGIRHPACGLDRLAHIDLGFRQRQRAPVRALDDGLACRLVIEWLDTRDISPLIASRLTMPNEATPANANVVRKDKALELDATVVLEMNRRNRHRRHTPALFT